MRQLNSSGMPTRVPLISTIEAIIAEDSREATNIAEFWLSGSLCARDFDGARRALAALPIAGCYDDTIPFPRVWCEGVVAQMGGDQAAARSAFISARNEAAKLVAEQPNYAEALCVLGMADAALGNKEDAIREGRRAVELLPVTKDAIIGAQLAQIFRAHLCVDRREGSCVTTANRCHKHPRLFELRRITSASTLGSIARRSTLRQDCRLARAEVSDSWRRNECCSGQQPGNLAKCPTNPIRFPIKFISSS